MDKTLVLICVILHFYDYILCDEPQKFNETCVDVKMPESMTSFELSCDEDSVITYVNVTLGVGSCKLERCVGDTPSFIVQLHSCYWKNKCTITMPDDIIVKVRDQDDLHCIGNIPTFLKVSNVRCFKPYALGNGDNNASRIIDICEESQIAFDAGIIRSHPEHPWDYGYHKKNCQLHMFVRVGQPLTITVQENELGESDSLMMMTADGRVTNLTDQRPEYSQLVSNEGSAVDIIYKIDQETAGGPGFLLCFSFNDVNYKGTNACNAITRTGSIRQVNVTDKHSIPFEFLKTAQTIPQPADENCKKRRRNGKCRRKRPKKDRKNKRDRKGGKNKRKKGKKEKGKEENNKN